MARRPLRHPAPALRLLAEALTTAPWRHAAPPALQRAAQRARRAAPDVTGAAGVAAAAQALERSAGRGPA